MRRTALSKFHFEPYQDWPVCESNDFIKLNAFIASKGVVCPPSFLKTVLEQGIHFQETSPASDSLWLNRLAFDEGIDVLPLGADPDLFHRIPGTDKTGLGFDNITCGTTQMSLAEFYSSEERAELFRLQSGQ